MCGRFTNKLTWTEIVALYRLTMDRPPHNMRADYNVCPTDPVDTVVEHEGQRDLVQMRWGLVPYWWSKPLKELRAATFNARVETVETKPFFRESFKRKRCLMPISGYYEWQNTPHGKQPWYFTARDGSPILTVAALWDEWKNRETGERLKSCAMIITEPNDFVAEVHDRMPVLLKPDQFEHWLSGVVGVEDLKPAPTTICSAGLFLSESIVPRPTALSAQIFAGPERDRDAFQQVKGLSAKGGRANNSSPAPQDRFVRA
jgi:putative SOS response-associated peptidase YedK